MKENQVFEISGRSKWAVFHWGGIVVFYIFTLVMLLATLYYKPESALIIIPSIILFLLISIILYRPASAIFALKTIRIDEDNLYFYLKDKLMNKITLGDIKRVTYDNGIRGRYQYMFFGRGNGYRFWGNYFFRILYKEDNEHKSLFISEWEFNEDDVIKIYYGLKRRLKGKIRPIKRKWYYY
jgi:hypothetical protein